MSVEQNTPHIIQGMLHGRGVMVHGHPKDSSAVCTGHSSEMARATCLASALSWARSSAWCESSRASSHSRLRDLRAGARALSAPGAPGPGPALGRALLACSISGMPSTRQPWGLAAGSTLSHSHARLFFLCCRPLRLLLGCMQYAWMPGSAARLPVLARRSYSCCGDMCATARRRTGGGMHVRQPPGARLLLRPLGRTAAGRP